MGAWRHTCEFTASGKDYFTCRGCSASSVAAAKEETAVRLPYLVERAKELERLEPSFKVSSLRNKFTSADLNTKAHALGAPRPHAVSSRAARRAGPYRTRAVRCAARHGGTLTRVPGRARAPPQAGASAPCASRGATP